MGKIRSENNPSHISEVLDAIEKPKRRYVSTGKPRGRPRKEKEVVIPNPILEWAKSNPDDGDIGKMLLEAIKTALLGQPLGEIGALTAPAWVSLVKWVTEMGIVDLGVGNKIGATKKLFAKDALDSASMMLDLTNEDDENLKKILGIM